MLYYTNMMGQNKGHYDHKKIEKKWQKWWKRKKIYQTEKPGKAPKFYVLDMFPYPSGEGLHVGHPKGYIATDVVSRMKRMQGFNVLHPMGFDAFGLPAEQYAIKQKINPAVAVAKNVAHYKKQLEIIGFDYDWSREVNTTDPKFYKWTQWIFLKLLEKGLAYEAYAPINWCPVDMTGLANEDVENGRCERCGALVEKRMMRQWVLKITDYADRLLNDLDTLNWPESIKASQRNWIGRSEGAELSFNINPPKTGIPAIKVFTTRPDTLFGVTYVVLAPEHQIAKDLIELVSNKDEVLKYIEKAKAKNEIDRTDATKEKTGVELKGIKVINPANKEEVPVWIADYVLPDYGTGAVMAVPAHDERDMDFSKKYNLPVKEITPLEEDKKTITEKYGGKWTVKYKLKDWVFSRQRYWGEPIPVFHDKEGKIIPVSEKDLPVKLPKVKYYEPTGTGESPLINIPKWVNVTKNGEKLKRETNTMPQWAGSSWYYLRYMDPKNKKKIVSSEKEKYFSNVDLYIGGAEHATRHLIYARFWHKFLYDIGVTSTIEPFNKFQPVGLILAEDGRKMSKRWGNVINPDDIVNQFGADTLRVYEMFMGPFDQAIAWSTNSMVGARRFVERIWSHSAKATRDEKDKDSNLELIIHKTIKKVGEDINNLHFNTAISALMILLNEFEKAGNFTKKQYETLLLLAAPFAPHITEEIWSTLNHTTSIHIAKWPVYDKKLFENELINLVIQINGKARATLKTEKNKSEDELFEIIKELPMVKKWLNKGIIFKKIYVPNRVFNILVDDNT